jgi:hypothetical protein
MPKSKGEFEDAAKNNDYITDAADMFSVQESKGWDPLAVYSERIIMDGLPISATYNNLAVGLGG